MERNYHPDLKDLLQFLPQQIFLEKNDKNLIHKLKEYYETLGFSEGLNKIYVLFILKLCEDKDISSIKYEEVKTILSNSEKLSKKIDCEDLVKSLEKESDFQKIREAYNLFTTDYNYPYLTWNYIKIFGKDSKNFQDIFQIIISSFFNNKIDCQFQFPNDDKFFISISEHIKEIYYQLYNIGLNNNENSHSFSENNNSVYYSEERELSINSINNTERNEIFNERNNLKKENYTKNEIIKEDNKDIRIKGKDNEKDEGQNKLNIIQNEKNQGKKKKIRRKTKFLRLAKQNKVSEKSRSNNYSKIEKNIKEEINDDVNEINKEISDNDDDSIISYENVSEDINNNNDDIIKDLKSDLKPKMKLKNYFQKMLEYYGINASNRNYYYLYDLANNDYYSLDNKFLFKINYDKSPFVSNMFQFLKEQLKSVKDTNNKLTYKEYQGQESFGFLILDKIEYFYVFKNEYNRELFNDINNVKLYELENNIEVPISSFSNKTGNEAFDKIDSHFLTSEDFENKINKFFKEFKLKELPTYFFRLIGKNKISDTNKDNKSKGEEEQDKKRDVNKISMEYVDKNYFITFIEIDGAFAYLNDPQLIIIDEYNKKFKLSKTINVSSYGEHIDINDEDQDIFLINKNSILLIEDKLSFPKIIKDLKRDKMIKKEDLYNSLNFVIYKSIKKINIFKEYLISTSEGKKENYSYYLLLIYDSNPIKNVENYIKDIIMNLSNEKLINYNFFHIKVIYV